VKATLVAIVWTAGIRLVALLGQVAGDFALSVCFGQSFLVQGVGLP